MIKHIKFLQSKPIFTEDLWRRSMRSSQDAGLCAAPQELWGIYGPFYGNSRSQGQIAHRNKVNAILKECVNGDGIERHLKLHTDINSMLLKALGQYLCETNLNNFEENMKNFQTPSDERLFYPQESYSGLLKESSTDMFSKARQTTNLLTTLNINGGLGDPADLNTIIKGMTFHELFFWAKSHYRIAIPQPPESLKTTHITGFGVKGFFKGNFFTSCAKLNLDSCRYLYSIFDSLLMLMSKTQDCDQLLGCILLYVFLYGTNPHVFVKNNGGTFSADLLLQYFLNAYGLKPIRKNFLNLTELELFSCFSQGSPEKWHRPINAYWESVNLNKINEFFHPEESLSIDFISYLYSLRTQYGSQLAYQSFMRKMENISYSNF
tara:strand:- start:1019 stop:2152 length:1134 start_codon:yes stop_codon:yes gene_type:complete